VLDEERNVRHVQQPDLVPEGGALDALELADDERHRQLPVVAGRLQDRELAPAPLGDLRSRLRVVRLGYVEPIGQGLPLDANLLGRLRQVLAQRALAAPTLHCRVPAIEAGAFVEVVQHGEQAHALARSPLVNRLVGNFVRTTTAGPATHREADLQLHRVGRVLDNRAAAQLVEAGRTGLRLERRAGRVMPRPGPRHALDDVQAMPGGIHLDAAANAQAARAFRGVVDGRERGLQRRVADGVSAAVDEGELGFHGLGAERLRRECGMRPSRTPRLSIDATSRRVCEDSAAFGGAIARRPPRI
jgi:hypothetical protein